ncbi:defensin-like protein 19 [Alnus glutinosa]|uniref:defensin-like protein 19 n=1 Tax=Alnus glutinosa TaxID=3517 RepID=UPI002D7814E5|nr:defensin-like protein 19 [Alnus glutinosa]XP_062178016.1 defensin-like protein 19 [Alnus glutinosa]
MVKSSKSIYLFAIFLIFILAAKMMMKMATAQYLLCGRRSRTWSGFCSFFSSDGCDRQCQHWEDAFSGACHGFPHHACYCYYFAEYKQD